jgi:hypothetical protein
VLRVRRASAIAAEEQRAPSLHCLPHHLMRALEDGTQLVRDSLRGGGEVAQSIGER